MYILEIHLNNVQSAVGVGLTIGNPIRPVYRGVGWGGEPPPHREAT